MQRFILVRLVQWKRYREVTVRRFCCGLHLLSIGLVRMREFTGHRAEVPNTLMTTYQHIQRSLRSG